MLVGRMGDNAALAAAGLGDTLLSCCGLSICIGICSALDTLVSQSYGAGWHDLSCHYLQRCRVVLTLQLCWIIPVLCFTQQCLTSIGQDEEVSQDAGLYNRANVVGLFALFQSRASMSFMTNQRRPTPVTVITIVTAVFHIGWCTLFVVTLGMGNAGAGYANSVTWVSQFVATSLYIWWLAGKMGVSRQAVLWIQRPGLREFGPFTRVAFYSTMALISEWWFWEIAAIMVGYLGPTALAAHVLSMNIITIMIMPGIGISSTAATVVGNAIGANLPATARQATMLCVGLNFCVWAVLGVCLLAWSARMAGWYTEDAEVLAIAIDLLAIYAMVGFFDTSQSVMAGAMRGLGKPKISAIVYMVTSYVCMLPLAYIFSFPLHQGVYGVWRSMFMGPGIAFVTFVVLLSLVSYGRLASEAALQMQKV